MNWLVVAAAAGMIGASSLVCAQTAPGIRVYNNGMSDFSRTAHARVGTDVTIRAYEAPVGMLLKDVAKTSGLSLHLDASLDLNKRISPSFTGLTPGEALAVLAQLAGYRVEHGAHSQVRVLPARVGSSESNWQRRR